MKFVCERCQTRYSIADEKVRGKILKVRCKSCQNVITVREAAAGVDASVVQIDEEHTVLAPIPSLAEAVAVPAARGSGVMPAMAVPPPAPPPPPPARDRDEVQWYLALDGNRTGPFTRKMLVDKLAALPPDADLHVWNEKLGDWKEPDQVPVIARELQGRRKPTLPPMPGAGLHSGPHPVPGASRRRASGSHPALALEPASPRRTAHSLPAPSGVVAPAAGAEPPLAAAAHAPPAANHPPGRPTHPPGVATIPGGRKSANGLAVNGSGEHGSALRSESSSSGLAPAGLPAQQPWPEGKETPGSGVPTPAPASSLSIPNLGTDVARPTGWQAGSVPIVTSPARHRSAKLILASMGIVGVIIVLVTFSLLNKKAPPARVEPAKPAAAPADNFAQLADKLAGQGSVESAAPAAEPAPPASVESPRAESTATVRPLAPGRGKLKGKNRRGARDGGRGGGTQPISPPSFNATSAQGATEAPAPGSYMGTERQVQLRGAGGGAKATPSQADISRVINNNKNGIKICYQRALLKDSSLTHGKINVRVSLGLSGKVKNVGIDGPPAFLTLQPCIKDLVSRWAFPPSSEAYESEFSYVFQGNE